MSRRRRTSLFEDLIDIATLLPYWASLLIAVVAYFLFHTYANSEIEIVTGSASVMAQNVTGTFSRGISSFLQYIIPLAFVLGAITSAVKSFKARTQAKRYEQWLAPSSEVSSPRPEKGKQKPTDEMNWGQFELLVGEAFRLKGYTVIHGGDAGADGGVDVRLRKDGKRYFVQCKHWKTQRVGVTVIRELYGVMVSSGVAGGYVVTSGEFTEEAVRFADGKPLKLINGNGLARMLGRDLEVNLKSKPNFEIKTEIVKCPKCSSPMVKRVAKRGQRAGQEFWGCSQFPNCRGTLPKS